MHEAEIRAGPQLLHFSIQLMNYLVLLHYALGTRTLTTDAGPLFKRPQETWYSYDVTI